MRVTFRVDARHVMGIGHLMRCLTLADALSAEGSRCTFVVRNMPAALGERVTSAGHGLHRLPPAGRAPGAGNSPYAAWLDAGWADDAAATVAALDGDKTDWLVVDHYALDRRWTAALRPHAMRILVIDDLADRQHEADLLLDQNAVAEVETRYSALIPPGCVRLLGPRYALLRPEFAARRRQGVALRRAVQRLFVFLGGTDPPNVTQRAMDAITALDPPIGADIVIGSSHRERAAIAAMAAADARFALHVDTTAMAVLMARADLAIGAGGTASWERLALGLPTLAVTMATNQAPINARLAALGVVRHLGTAEELAVGPIVAAVTALRDDPAGLAAMSAAGLAIVDGGGARRVVAAMRAGMLMLRAARRDDVERLLAWRNDPETRRRSRSTTAITESGHRRWLDGRLADPGGQLFIGLLGETPIGCLRFDPPALGSGRRLVSITVAPAWRGQGIGGALLAAGCKAVAPAALRAEIKDDNAASRRIFLACGFRLEKRDAACGESAYILDMAATEPAA